MFVHLDKMYEIIDMRAFYLKLEDKINYNNLSVYEEIKKIVVDCMTLGKYLVLNYDHCSVQYNKNYDANVKEFYGKKMLSPFMFTPKIFFEYHCWNNHLNEKNETFRMDKRFRYFLYSKIIIDSNMGENEVLNMIEKRFGFSFSLDRVHVIIVEN